MTKAAALRWAVITAALLCAAALAFVSCGMGKQPAGSGGLQAADSTFTDLMGSLESAFPGVLAELDALACPEGVDSALWTELKSALQTQLTESRPGSPARLLDTSEDSGAKAPRTGDGENHGRDARATKIVSTPPTGEANRVNDLAIADNGDGTYSLTWHYRNLGDYGQNGKVAIADITPLAQHFGETYNPVAEPNSIQAVIDGSGNGRVGIEDVTPIAQCFQREVHHYVIEGAEAQSGPWSAVGEVAQAAGTGDGRLEYAETIQSPAALWHRVVPYDAEGNPGEPSNAVLRPSNEPIIYEVSPTTGYQHEECAFSAVVSGAEPRAYAWDFGGGADPDTSSDVSPTVTLADAGEYSATLTVSNSYGETSHPFTLTVLQRDEWAHTWGTSTDDICRDIAIGPTGDLFLAATGVGAVVLRVDSQGNFIWARSWTGDKGASAGNIALDGNGDLIVSGGTRSFGEGNGDYLLLKYSVDGELLRAMTWGTSDYEYRLDMNLDDAGNTYMCGNWSVYGGYPLALVVKLDPDWNVLWAKRWGGNGWDSAQGILATGDAVYVCGETSSFGSSEDAFILKMNPEGEVLWARTWSTELDDSFGALALGPDGCVYVEGNSIDYPTVRTGVVAKYEPSGALITTAGWRGPLESAFSDVNVSSAGVISAVGAEGWHLLLLQYDLDLNVVSAGAWGLEEQQAWGRAIVRESQGYLCIAGYGQNAQGEWIALGDWAVDPVGVDTPVVGSVWDLEGVTHDPEGILTTREGVIDTGGGGDDVLVLKRYIP